MANTKIIKIDGGFRVLEVENDFKKKIRQIVHKLWNLFPNQDNEKKLDKIMEML